MHAFLTFNVHLGVGKVSWHCLDPGDAKISGHFLSIRMDLKNESPLNYPYLTFFSPSQSKNGNLEQISAELNWRASTGLLAHDM